MPETVPVKVPVFVRSMIKLGPAGRTDVTAEVKSANDQVTDVGGVAYAKGAANNRRDVSASKGNAF